MAERVLIGNVRGLQGPPGPSGAPGSPGTPGRDAAVDTVLNENSSNAIANAAVTKRLNEVFTSVSEGKVLMASAITDKGVATDATATFEQMAEHIAQIKTGESLQILSSYPQKAPAGLYQPAYVTAAISTYEEVLI